MNRLIHNPNLCRFGLPLAVVAVLGSVSCNPEKPAPTPSETTVGTASRPTPTCALSAKVAGRTAVISLSAKNEDELGVYDVKNVEYTYGDGQSSTALEGAAVSHPYAKAGTYAISANMIMGVAPGAEADAPFRDGFAIPCTPISVTIE